MVHVVQFMYSDWYSSIRLLCKKLPSVVGMALHVVWHLRLDCINPIRELPSCMTNVFEAAMKHINYVCHFMVKRTDWGMIIAHNNPGSWDGTRNFLFVISGKSDANWANDPT